MVGGFMQLTFLGNGSAFNVDAYNTCAYFKTEKSLFLLDCGESICNKILKLKLMDSVENIYVFITHTHSDHIGSLEALIYYNEVFLHKNFKIFYPRRCKLKKLLILTGVDFPFKIYPIPQELDGMKIDCVVQKHIPGSYGYFFYGQESGFFFSGDASEVNPRCVEELKNGKIGKVYHEVTTSGSRIHTHLDKLKACFPEDLRDKVWLMHFENEDMRRACEQAKFQTVEVENA